MKKYSISSSVNNICYVAYKSLPIINASLKIKPGSKMVKNVYKELEWLAGSGRKLSDYYVPSVSSIEDYLKQVSPDAIVTREPYEYLELAYSDFLKYAKTTGYERRIKPPPIEKSPSELMLKYFPIGVACRKVSLADRYFQHSRIKTWKKEKALLEKVLRAIGLEDEIIGQELNSTSSSAKFCMKLYNTVASDPKSIVEKHSLEFGELVEMTCSNLRVENIAILRDTWTKFNKKNKTGCTKLVDDALANTISALNFGRNDELKIRGIWMYVNIIKYRLLNSGTREESIEQAIRAMKQFDEMHTTAPISSKD